MTFVLFSKLQTYFTQQKKKKVTNIHLKDKLMHFSYICLLLSGEMVNWEIYLDNNLSTLLSIQISSIWGN